MKGMCEQGTTWFLQFNQSTNEIMHSQTEADDTSYHCSNTIPRSKNRNSHGRNGDEGQRRHVKNVITVAAEDGRQTGLTNLIQLS